MAVIGKVPPQEKPAENPAGIQAELPLHILSWQQGIASLPTGFSRSLRVLLGTVDCAEDLEDPSWNSQHCFPFCFQSFPV